jgi:phosphate uptake regulator
VEYRKLIKFGKNSFIVSLPKQWVDHNNLKKGSLIHIQPNGHQLTLLAKPESQNDKLSETVIDMDHLSIEAVKRLICSAYINNVRVMHITGKNLSKNADYIRSILHNMIALEIQEQTPSRIIARDYLNMQEIRIEGLMRKTDNIIRSMFVDLVTLLKNPSAIGAKDLAQSVSARDVDVNRFTFLALRAVKYQLSNPLLVEDAYSSEELVHMWDVAQNIERIADELKYCSRLITSIPSSSVSDIAQFFGEGYAQYLAIMKAHYAHDHEDAVRLGDRRKEFQAKVAQLMDGADVNTVSIAEHLRNLVRSTHDLNRMTYHWPVT